MELLQDIMEDVKIPKEAQQKAKEQPELHPEVRAAKTPPWGAEWPLPRQPPSSLLFTRGAHPPLVRHPGILNRPREGLTTSQYSLSEFPLN